LRSDLVVFDNHGKTTREYLDQVIRARYLKVLTRAKPG